MNSTRIIQIDITYQNPIILSKVQQTFSELIQIQFTVSDENLHSCL